MSYVRLHRLRLATLRSSLSWIWNIIIFVISDNRRQITAAQVYDK